MFIGSRLSYSFRFLPSYRCKSSRMSNSMVVNVINVSLNKVPNYFYITHIQPIAMAYWDCPWGLRNKIWYRTRGKVLDKYYVLEPKTFHSIQSAEATLYCNQQSHERTTTLFYSITVPRFCDTNVQENASRSAIFN